MKEIYLDNHSGTRLDEAVYNEMVPYLTDLYGNAQSMHSIGAKSRDVLEKARHQIADLIGANDESSTKMVLDEEIYFTSCGSESNNLAITDTRIIHAFSVNKSVSLAGQIKSDREAYGRLSRIILILAQC